MELDRVIGGVLAMLLPASGRPLVRLVAVVVGYYPEVVFADQMRLSHAEGVMGKIGVAVFTVVPGHWLCGPLAGSNFEWLL